MDKVTLQAVLGAIRTAGHSSRINRKKRGVKRTIGVTAERTYEGDILINYFGGIGYTPEYEAERKAQAMADVISKLNEKGFDVIPAERGLQVVAK